ncbi:MAG: 8-oxo-dGTP diphosphatase MutT [Phycisphaeraceae bacterium]|nr:8-oxo-dGTP diphosphatase MutT [Phycisphaeraceae bacterium]
MPESIDVAIGILTERRAGQWFVFITRRRDESVLGGYWEMPGGKVARAESHRSCVAREFAEEVALEVEVGASLPVIVHEYDHATVRLHPFFCTRRDGDPRDLEVDEHRWVCADDLAGYRFPPANDTLIERVVRAIDGWEGAADG